MSGEVRTRWGWFVAMSGATRSAIGFATALWAIAFSTNSALAQITPDKTLPNNSTVRLDGSTHIIEGGTRAGGNLFHSFGEFSVRTGETAHFNNATDIQNIFSRVTGGAVSNIDGVLQANGTANLFLINPNGIIFGKNASLNVGGSFVGTTANAIQFGNLGTFNASVPNNPALLTVNPTALFYNQIAAGASIQNNSQASVYGQAPVYPVYGNSVGLQVPDGKSLLLVGGSVNLDEGALTANGGRVELASLAAPGLVGLNMTGYTFSLNVPNDLQRSDVSLTNQAAISVSGASGGDITINARNLNISNSSLVSGIRNDLGNVSVVVGDTNLNATGVINLNATGVINLVQGSLVGNGSNYDATGNGSNINISTGSLSVQNDAEIATGPFGQTNGGNISIHARDAITLNGNGIYGFTGIFSNLILGSSSIPLKGKGGSISLTTGSLSLSNGAQINSSFARQGDGGDISIHARDAITLNGNGIDSSTGIFSNVSTKGVGNGGNISLTTGSLSLTNGAQIGASTDGQGNGGDINIHARDAITLNGNGIDDVNEPFAIGAFTSISSNVSTKGVGNGGNISLTTGSLSLTNGAQIGASTDGQGNGGDINIHARDAIILNGNSSFFPVTGVFSEVAQTGVGKGGTIKITTAGSMSLYNSAQLSANTNTGGRGDAGSINITASDTVSFDGVGRNGFPSSASSAVETGASGNGGNLTVATKRLNILNGAEGTVSNLGSGNAGNLEVFANSIHLNNQGKLTANSVTGYGGNIGLQAKDILLMRRGSLISNTSGTAQTSGNGGNFTLNTKFLVAVPKENSDIITNAFNGSGGNISIAASGIFGIQYRKQLTPESDIVAIGKNITPPTLYDPTRGLVQIPINLVDASSQIDTSCNPGSKQRASSFTITGRGGLPPNPRTEPLTSDAVEVDWVSLKPDIRKHKIHTVTKKPTPTPEPIVQATGWTRNAKGEVVLTYDASNVTPPSPGLNPASCHGVQNHYR